MSIQWSNFNINSTQVFENRNLDLKFEDENTNYKFKDNVSNDSCAFSSVKSQENLLSILGLKIAETPYDDGYKLKYAEDTLQPYFEQVLNDGTKQFVRIAVDENGNTNIIQTEIKA